MRADPLNGLLVIDDPEVPTMALTPAGDTRLCEGEGPPWIVSCRVSGTKGGPYYVPGGVRVRMLLDSAYPRTPPEVHFMQSLHHFFLDNDNGLPPIFYELLEDTGDAGRHTLRATMLLVRIMLQAPLHPCEGCQAQFDEYAKMHQERLQTIARYSLLRRHPSLFDVEVGWRDEWIAPALREALASADEGALAAVLHEEAEGVYTFPLLSEACCAMLVAEVECYSGTGLPVARPNSMNKYGLVLNEIGMEPLFDQLQCRVLGRISAHLFPCEGAALDRHHSFTVKYEPGKDLGLDMHVDNSDVTFNVCLGKEFTGAGLAFCGYMGEPHHRTLSYTYVHRKGHCVVHLGRRRHGADDIQSGERMNLIIWNHNLAYRASRAYTDLQHQRRYLKEAGPPDLECLSYTHDRDYLKYREPPQGHAKMTRRAWCPPLFARHDAPDQQAGAARRVLLREAVMGGDLSEGEDFDDLDGAAGDEGAAGEVFGYDTLRELQAALRMPDADGAILEQSR